MNFHQTFTHADKMGVPVPDNVQWSKYTQPVVIFRVGPQTFCRKSRLLNCSRRSTNLHQIRCVLG